MGRFLKSRKRPCLDVDAVHKLLTKTYLRLTSPLLHMVMFQKRSIAMSKVANFDMKTAQSN